MSGDFDFAARREQRAQQEAEAKRKQRNLQETLEDAATNLEVSVRRSFPHHIGIQRDGISVGIQDGRGGVLTVTMLEGGKYKAQSDYFPPKFNYKLTADLSETELLDVIDAWTETSNR